MSGEDMAALFQAAYPELGGDPHAFRARDEAEAALTLDAILNRDEGQG